MEGSSSCQHSQFIVTDTETWTVLSGTSLICALTNRTRDSSLHCTSANTGHVQKTGKTLATCHWVRDQTWRVLTPWLNLDEIRGEDDFGDRHPEALPPQGVVGCVGCRGSRRFLICGDHRAVLTMWKHVELDTYNLCTPLYHLFFNNVVHLKIYRLRHHKLEGPLDSDEENGVLCLPYHEFTSENQLTYVGFWISMGKKKNDLNQVILIFLPTPGVSNPLTEVSGFLHFKNQY